MDKDLKKAVVEIEEVEYLITEETERQISEGQEFIKLIRLIDGKEGVVSLKDLKKIFEEGGIVDHLD